MSSDTKKFDANDARPLTRVAVAIIERTVDGKYQVLFLHLDQTQAALCVAREHRFNK